MPPDTDPELRSVILYRLDSLDRNVSRLVTTESHEALTRRVSVLEAQHEERDRWTRQLTLAAIIAALSGVITLFITLFTSGGI